MILSKLQAIDASLYEAAEIDGVSVWQKFRYITLPEIYFVIGAIVILRVIWNFNKFEETYLFTENVKVLSVYIYFKAFTGAMDQGQGASLALIQFLLLIVFFAVFPFLLSFSAALLSLILATLGAYSFCRVKYRGQSAIQRGVLEEAALIDGCSRFETIIRIIVPLSLPALITVFIYAFMIAWNEYLFASVFLKSFKDLYTLPLGLKSLFYSKHAIWDRIMAASMLTAVPVVIMFMLVQKNLTRGLTAGGVKE